MKAERKKREKEKEGSVNFMTANPGKGLVLRKKGSFDWVVHRFELHDRY